MAYQLTTPKEEIQKGMKVTIVRLIILLRIPEVREPAILIQFLLLYPAAQRNNWLVPYHKNKHGRVFKQAPQLITHNQPSPTRFKSHASVND